MQSLLLLLLTTALAWPSLVLLVKASQQSEANALCAFKLGIINWPFNPTMSPTAGRRLQDTPVSGLTDEYFRSNDEPPVVSTEEPSDNNTENNKNAFLSPTPRRHQDLLSAADAAPQTLQALTPSFAPTIAAVPTRNPSLQPTVKPSFVPSRGPTASPTYLPTISPSYLPSIAPSASPSFIPTVAPSVSPSISFKPSPNPTFVPSFSFKPTPIPTISPRAMGWDCIGAVAQSRACGPGSVSWTGVTCSGSSIASFDMSGQVLYGTITPQLSELTGLTSLSLHSNNLGGAIPTAYSTLTNLQYLNLNYNYFSNSLPPQFSTMTKMVSFSVSGNNLWYSLPSQYSTMVNLNYLDVSSNALFGTIPSHFSNLMNLNTLSLSSNQFTRTTPSQLSVLTKLQTLLISSNYLTGTICSLFSALTNMNYLYLSSNYHTGTVPSQLSTMTKLLYLVLTSNGLTNSIPSQLSALRSLDAMYLNDNQLTNSIPSQLSALSASLNILDLSQNLLSKTITSEISLLTSLNYLNLNNNRFSGNIPSCFSTLTNAQSIYLSSCTLSGNIPTQLSTLRGLLRLSIDGNSLTGTFPSHLSTLTSLNYLSANNNRLTGQIPTQISKLNGLSYLYLNSNSFMGTIPDGVSALVNLWELDLSFNSLYGLIPSFGYNSILRSYALTRLYSLRLNDNQLDGPAGTFLCFPNMPIYYYYGYLRLQNNMLACMQECAALRTTSSYRDSVTPIGTDPQCYNPTSQPSRQPSIQPSSNPSNPSSQPSSQPSKQPSRQPSSQPSMQPSRHPSSQPSRQPLMRPSMQPSSQPTMQPSMQPFSRPSLQPSVQPSRQPSAQPFSRPSSQPSSQPVMKPSMQPSSQPSMQPSSQPYSRPSTQPSIQPTMQPSRQPFGRPSAQPSFQPASIPSMQPSSQPTMQPSRQPFGRPSMQPTKQPASIPSMQPSSKPSMQPSSQPSSKPSMQPSLQPSMQPSAQPYSRPSTQPSLQPTMQPSSQPFSRPSSQPSSQPVIKPSMQPSRQPSSRPSMQPFSCPSTKPSVQPSREPSSQPSLQPSRKPSNQPSNQPTIGPTIKPSSQPSSQPSCRPSNSPNLPSAQPSCEPITRPSCQPSSQPSLRPSSQPSVQPSTQPVRKPTSQPSCRPTMFPINIPTTQPSCLPSSKPSFTPLVRPTNMPSGQPSSRPYNIPSRQPSSHPSMQPFTHPSVPPSSQPSSTPSTLPSYQPSSIPSSQPSTRPSIQPFGQPSSHPSMQPFTHPSVLPSSQPSSNPSTLPSYQPSSIPSSQPSTQPSSQPSSRPSQPSSQPTMQPFSAPSDQPTMQPTNRPSKQPSSQPSTRPSVQPSMQPSTQPSSQPSSHPTSVFYRYRAISIKICNVSASQFSIKVHVCVGENSPVHCMALDSRSTFSNPRMLTYFGHMNVSRQDSTYIHIPDLSPSSRYAVYCTSVSSRNKLLSLPDIKAQATTVSTKCCKRIEVLQYRDVILKTDTLAKVFEVKIDFLPSVSVRLDIDLTRSDGAKLPLFPSYFVFSNQSFTRKYFSFTPPFESEAFVGSYNISYRLSGQSSAEYRVSYFGSSVLNVSRNNSVASNTNLKTQVNIVKATCLTDYSYVQIIFDNPTNLNLNGYDLFPCSSLFNFSCSVMSDCLFISSNELSLFPRNNSALSCIRSSCNSEETIEVLHKSRLDYESPPFIRADLPPVVSKSRLSLSLSSDPDPPPILSISAPIVANSRMPFMLDLSSSFDPLQRKWSSLKVFVNSDIPDRELDFTPGSKTCVLQQLNPDISSPVKIFNSSSLGDIASLLQLFDATRNTFSLTFIAELCVYTNKCSLISHYAKFHVDKGSTNDDKEGRLPFYRILGPVGRNFRQVSGLPLRLTATVAKVNSDYFDYGNSSSSNISWFVRRAYMGDANASSNASNLLNVVSMTLQNPLRFELNPFSFFSFSSEYLNISVGVDDDSITSCILINVQPYHVVTTTDEVHLFSIYLNSKIQFSALNNLGIPDSIPGETPFLKFNWTSKLVDGNVMLTNSPCPVTEVSSADESSLMVSFDGASAAVMASGDKLICEISVHISDPASKSLLLVRTYFLKLIKIDMSAISVSTSVSFTSLTSLSTTKSVSASFISAHDSVKKVNFDKRLAIYGGISIMSLSSLSPSKEVECSWSSSILNVSILLDKSQTNLARRIQPFIPDYLSSSPSSSPTHATTVYSMNLVFPKYTLPRNSRFSVTLSCILVDNTGSSFDLSSSTILIQTNLPPFNGYFELNATSGISFVDTFHMSADKWIDDDLPLSYQFEVSSYNFSSVDSENYYYDFSNHNIQLEDDVLVSDFDSLLLKGRSEISYCLSKLVGDAGGSPFVILLVFDSLDVSIMKSKQVSLTTSEPPLKVENRLVEILDSMVDTISSKNSNSVMHLDNVKLLIANTLYFCEHYSAKSSKVVQQRRLRSSTTNGNSASISFSSLHRSCEDNCSTSSSLDRGLCVSISSYRSNPRSSDGKSECLVDDVSCQVACLCKSSYAGSDCSYDVEQLDSRKTILKHVSELLAFLITNEQVTSENVRNWLQIFGALVSVPDESVSSDPKKLLEMLVIVLETISDQHPYLLSEERDLQVASLIVDKIVQVVGIQYVTDVLDVTSATSQLNANRTDMGLRSLVSRSLEVLSRLSEVNHVFVMDDKNVNRRVCSSHLKHLTLCHSLITISPYSTPQSRKLMAFADGAQLQYSIEVPSTGQTADRQNKIDIYANTTNVTYSEASFFYVHSFDYFATSFLGSNSSKDGSPEQLVASDNIEFGLVNVDDMTLENLFHVVVLSYKQTLNLIFDDDVVGGGGDGNDKVGYTQVCINDDLEPSSLRVVCLYNAEMIADVSPGSSYSYNDMKRLVEANSDIAVDEGSDMITVDVNGELRHYKPDQSDDAFSMFTGAGIDQPTRNNIVISHYSNAYLTLEGSEHLEATCDAVSHTISAICSNERYKPVPYEEYFSDGSDCITLNYSTNAVTYLCRHRSNNSTANGARSMTLKSSFEISNRVDSIEYFGKVQLNQDDTMFGAIDFESRLIFYSVISIFILVFGFANRFYRVDFLFNLKVSKVESLFIQSQDNRSITRRMSNFVLNSTVNSVKSIQKRRPNLQVVDESTAVSDLEEKSKKSEVRSVSRSSSTSNVKEFLFGSDAISKSLKGKALHVHSKYVDDLGSPPLEGHLFDTSMPFMVKYLTFRSLGKIKSSWQLLKGLCYELLLHHKYFSTFFKVSYIFPRYYKLIYMLLYVLVFLGVNMALITKFEIFDKADCSLKTSMADCLGTAAVEDDVLMYSIYNGNFYGSHLTSDEVSLTPQDDLFASTSPIDTTNDDSLNSCSWRQVTKFNIGFCETTNNIAFSWSFVIYYTVLATVISVPIQFLLKYVFTHVLCASTRVNFRDKFATSRSLSITQSVNNSIKRLSKPVNKPKKTNEPSELAKFTSWMKNVPVEVVKDFTIFFNLNKSLNSSIMEDVISLKLEFSNHSKMMTSSQNKALFLAEWTQDNGNNPDKNAAPVDDDLGYYQNHDIGFDALKEEGRFSHCFSKCRRGNNIMDISAVEDKENSLWLQQFRQLKWLFYREFNSLRALSETVYSHCNIVPTSVNYKDGGQGRNTCFALSTGSATASWNYIKIDSEEHQSQGLFGRLWSLLFCWYYFLIPAIQNDRINLGINEQQTVNHRLTQLLFLDFMPKKSSKVLEKVFRFEDIPVRPLTESTRYISHVVIGSIICFFVCSLMYYSYLCPTSIQLLALGSVFLFVIVDIFVVEVLVVCYFRVLLPLLVNFDVIAVRRFLTSKYKEYQLKKQGNDNKENDKKTGFNGMKHAYLSYKVAKNMLKENNNKKKSVVASFVTKLESIWPSNSMRNLDLFYLKPEQASVHEEGRLLGICGDFFRTLFCCFCCRFKSNSYVSNGGLCSLIGQYFNQLTHDLTFYLFNKFSSFAIDVIVQYLACVLGLVLLVCFYMIYVEVSFSIFLGLLLFVLLVYSALQCCRVSVDEEGASEYPPIVKKNKKLRKSVARILSINKLGMLKKSLFSAAKKVDKDKSDALTAAKNIRNNATFDNDHDFELGYATKTDEWDAVDKSAMNKRKLNTRIGDGDGKEKREKRAEGSESSDEDEVEGDTVVEKKVADPLPLAPSRRNAIFDHDQDFEAGYATKSNEWDAVDKSTQRRKLNNANLNGRSNNDDDDDNGDDEERGGNHSSNKMKMMKKRAARGDGSDDEDSDTGKSSSSEAASMSSMEDEADY